MLKTSNGVTSWDISLSTTTLPDHDDKPQSWASSSIIITASKIYTADAMGLPYWARG
jgi:hypothetical protein